MQRQAAERRVGVELLRDRDKADAMPLKQLHHPGEIDQRTAEPIDLVNHDAIDLARLDVGKQLPDAGPFEIRTRVSAVAVLGRDKGPSLMPLAEDARLGRLALCV